MIDSVSQSSTGPFRKDLQLDASAYLLVSMYGSYVYVCGILRKLWFCVVGKGHLDCCIFGGDASKMSSSGFLLLDPGLKIQKGAVLARACKIDSKEQSRLKEQRETCHSWWEEFLVSVFVVSLGSSSFTS